MTMRAHTLSVIRWIGILSFCFALFMLYSKQLPHRPGHPQQVQTKRHIDKTHIKIQGPFSRHQYEGDHGNHETYEQQFDYDEEIELDDEAKSRMRFTKPSATGGLRPVGQPIVLQEKPQDGSRLTKPGLNMEVETYITFKVDDSNSAGLEITRCAQRSQLNSSSCFKPSAAANPLYNLTIWSQDYHPAAVQALKYLLEPLGVKFIDKSLSQHCVAFKSCGHGLRGIRSHEGINLQEDTVQQFQAEYIRDTQFTSTDAFLCIRPPAMCELFMPFGKSLLIYIDARFELGRFTLERWRYWIQNLLTISQNPKNIIAVSNEYDAQYVLYYTGYRPLLLPPMCHYILHTYLPITSTEFLLFPHKSSRLRQIFLKDFKKWNTAITNNSIILKDMKADKFDQSAVNLVRYAGIVMIPHQTSSLRMTEIYRMNIPIFAPSPQLLTRWHIDYDVVEFRTWKILTRLIPWSAGPKMPGKLSLPNPNDEKIESVGFWLSYVDLFIWPHILYFDNVKDLLTKMQKYSMNGKLKDTSRLMATHNQKEKSSILVKWRDILNMLQADKKLRM